MRLYITKDYESMSVLAKQFLLAQMVKQRRVNLAITGGNTPIRMYEMLVEEFKEHPIYQNVHFYNFDELPFVDGSLGATMSDLKRLFFDPAQVPHQQIHHFNEKNYLTFPSVLKQEGGLDAILIGIGADGHFCGNMPGHTYFENDTTVIPVPNELQDALKKAYQTDKEFEDYFVTMGPRLVMQSKQIILIANGKAKAAILKKALKGPVTVDIPSSVLQLHPDLVVICDEDAASELEHYAE